MEAEIKSSPTSINLIPKWSTKVLTESSLSWSVVMPCFKNAGDGLLLNCADKAISLFLRQFRLKLSAKKIYLIRHGQTDYNLRGIVQGSGIDSSLNAMGKLQRDSFFNYYGHLKFDKIYTSSLRRSIESIAPFIDLNVPHETAQGLNEINWGNKEGQKITPEEDRYYQWILKQWEEGNTSLAIEGGESPEQVAIRQRPVLDKIIFSEPDEVILVCMHGRAMRVFLCQLLNYPLCAMDLFAHGNLGLYLLQRTGAMWYVEKYNDTAHLLNGAATK